MVAEKNMEQSHREMDKWLLYIGCIISFALSFPPLSYCMPYYLPSYLPTGNLPTGYPPVIWCFPGPVHLVWIFEFWITITKKSIQNMTPNDISKFTYVNRSFILNTPYKKFQNSDQVNRPPIWLTCFIKISNGDLQCK